MRLHARWLLYPLAILVGHHRLERHLTLLDALGRVVETGHARPAVVGSEQSRATGTDQAQRAHCSNHRLLGQAADGVTHRFLLRFPHGAHRRQAWQGCGNSYLRARLVSLLAQTLRDSPISLNTAGNITE